jgi:hypothetical protein
MEGFGDLGGFPAAGAAADNSDGVLLYELEYVGEVGGNG